MKKRGFTLTETLASVGLFAIIALGTTSLIFGNIKSFISTTNQIDADQSASTALGIMSRNLQEAKQVQINSPTSITVFYPELIAGGTYNRNVLDTVNTVDFYRGNANGTANSSGTCLIRAPASGTLRAICKRVTNLDFTSISPSSVDVTLETQATTTSTTRRCQMIHRAIFLRNY